MNKRVRLPGGKWVTRKLPESNPAELAQAAPTDIWECGDGRRVLVRDMDTQHICNVIALLLQRARAEIARMKLTTYDDALFCSMHTPIYKTLHAELGKRLSQMPPLMPLPKLEQPELKEKEEEKPSRHFQL